MRGAGIFCLTVAACTAFAPVPRAVPSRTMATAASTRMAASAAKKVIVLGGDGFCGWPTSLNLSEKGHKVIIVDNLSRRNIDTELGCDSLTPIATAQQRVAAWNALSGVQEIDFVNLDVAKEYDLLAALIKSEKPDTVIHFAEQRAAPYSMKGAKEKRYVGRWLRLHSLRSPTPNRTRLTRPFFSPRYTIDNNLSGTHNLCAAIVESGHDVHVVHLDGKHLPDADFRLLDPRSSSARHARGAPQRRTSFGL